MNDGPISARQAIDAYATNRIAGASPGQLVLITYDYVLRCCRCGDTVNAKRGLIELTSGLNLEYLEVAGPLYRLYEYCLDRVREGDFAEVQRIVTELRDAWTEVLSVSEGQPRTASQENLEV